MKRALFFVCLCLAFVVRTAYATDLKTSFDVPLETGTGVSRATTSLIPVKTDASFSYVTLKNQAGNIIGYRTKSIEIDTPYTFTIQSINENVGKLEIQIGLLDNSYEVSSKADMVYYPGKVTMQEDDEGNLIYELSYTFRMYGTYAMLIYPCDNSGTVISSTDYLYINIPIENNGNTSELQRLIKQEVDQLNIRNTDSYTAALAIHDRIVDLCEYGNGDKSSPYHYYDPYVLLTKHVGVCNSYARTFDLMMKEAGYESRRIMGYPYGSSTGHAWNAALLNGKWYQIDTTWDDPTNGSSTHCYFGLPDSLMCIDHVYRCTACGESSVTCDSLEYNYYINSGTWKFCAANVLIPLQEQIDSGIETLSTPLENNYASDFKSFAGVYVSDQPAKLWGSIIAYALNSYQWHHTPSGESVLVTLRYNKTDNNNDYSFSGTYTRESVLALPASLAEIEEEAFAGVNARYVDVPEGCTTIGARAFADSGLWGVKLPASVTSIAIDAFEDSPWVHVLVPAGSDAARLVRLTGVSYATY